MAVTTFEDFYNLVKDRIVNIKYDVSDLDSFKENSIENITLSVTLSKDFIPEEFHTSTERFVSIYDNILNNNPYPYGYDSDGITPIDTTSFRSAPQYIKLYSRNTKANVVLEIDNITEVI